MERISRSPVDQTDILHMNRLDKSFRRLLSVEQRMEAGAEYELIGVPRGDGSNEMIGQPINKDVRMGIADVFLDEWKALKDSGHGGVAQEIIDAVQLEQVRSQLKKETPKDRVRTTGDY